jgi:hypothetical protein
LLSSGCCRTSMTLPERCAGLVTLLLNSVLTFNSLDTVNAAQELAALIASDAHPSVLRCFAMEEDANFIYVALERCVCTLADLFGARAPRASACT